MEVDETYHGQLEDSPLSPQRQPPYKKREGWTAPKRAIVSLVERGAYVRTFHVPIADTDTVNKIVLRTSTTKPAYTATKAASITARPEFVAHETVNHSAGEYAREDLTTKTVEGVFGIFKRGMRGIYQHCAEKNLHRYLAEFDFRYNTTATFHRRRERDHWRRSKGGEGKRLTYRQPHSAPDFSHAAKS